MDALAIGAHPDDCELFMGGTLARLADSGYSVAIADLSRGETASRGTPEARRAEAEEAARILGIDRRIALDLGDGEIGRDPGHRLEVIRLLRAERPSIVFTHADDDRHPDHVRAHHLVYEACFFSYVSGIDTNQERFRPDAVIEFVGNPPDATGPVSFIVPVAETFDRKMESLRAYRSQFHNPDYEGPATWISSGVYFQQIQARAQYWGAQIGENYGEPFRYRRTIAIADPVRFFRESGGLGR